MTAPSPRPGILEIAPYVGGEAQAEGVRRLIRLASNEGALGPSPRAAAAYRALGDDLHRYPDGGSAALTLALARRLDVDPRQIVCGAGSDELLALLARSYAGPGDEVLYSAHGFLMYPIAARAVGATPVTAAETNLTADVDALLAALTPRTRILFLANPNNPTGTFISSSETARLRAGLPADVLLVVDAAYAEYVDRPEYDPGTGLVDASDNTVMTRTFSKMFGMGGLRLGWGYAPQAVVDLLHRVRSPFNVSVPAAAAGAAALAEPGWVEKCRDHNNAERARVAASLTGAGIKVHPSEANFVLADFVTPARAEQADGHLRACGLIVRRVGGYGLPHCLRITIGLAAENDLLIGALQEFQASSRG